MQAIVATQAQHGGAVEGVTGGQVVSTATVQRTVGDAVAQVRAVVVDQKTTAQANGLAAGGNVHPILAQHREQVGRAPAEEGVFDLGGAFGAIGVAGRIAIAPGGRAHPVQAAVQRAVAGQALVTAEAILDKAFTPGRTPCGAVVVLAAVEHAPYRQHVGVQVAVIVGVQLVGRRGLAGQQGGQGQGGQHLRIDHLHFPRLFSAA
ncbi:hypothetical protein D3C80_1438220 [compost metagenome]